ncbi:MAG: hypothetical protein ACKVHO_14385 [Verrucomicrobiia bacterium]|jgi:hypothetical protein
MTVRALRNADRERIRDFRGIRVRDAAAPANAQTPESHHSSRDQASN